MQAWLRSAELWAAVNEPSDSRVTVRRTRFHLRACACERVGLADIDVIRHPGGFDLRLERQVSGVSVRVRVCAARDKEPGMRDRHRRTKRSEPLPHTEEPEARWRKGKVPSIQATVPPWGCLDRDP